MAHQVPDLATLVDAGVVVRAEVGEACGEIGQQVPDDDEDGSGDGREGLELAVAFDQAPLAVAEEGVGLGDAPWRARCGRHVSVCPVRSTQRKNRRTRSCRTRCSWARAWSASRSGPPCGRCSKGSSVRENA